MKLLAFVCSSLLSFSLMAGELIDKTIDVPSNNKIYIENDQGEIILKGWDKQQMQVSGTLDDRADGYIFRNKKGGRTEFIVEMPNHYSRKDGKGSKLTIFVPKTHLINIESVNADMDIAELSAGIVLDTVNGDIDIQDVTGRINLDTVNGDIKSHNLNGQIRIETVNGDIRDTNSQGDMRFEAVNGDLKSTTLSQDIRIESVNGDVEINADTIKNFEITTVGGEVEVAMKALSRGANIQAETVNGDILFKLPRDLSADVEIAAHAGGKIRNGLSKDKSKKAKYGPSSSLEFQLKDGDVEIEIDTVNGRIELKYN